MRRATCRDCGAPWVPVRRGECNRCGSDTGPVEVRCDFALTRCEQPPVARFEIMFCAQWMIVTRCARHRVSEGHYRQSWALASAPAGDRDGEI